tara:strand:- start:2521 stop:2892 length:372 start_codon:yes stop_codon:yes gene_type:complete
MSEIIDEPLSTKSLDDEFHRKKKYINACNFDDATLRRRDIEMKELEKAYPNMCKSWLELAWNYCEFTPKEEQDKIIASKEWEKAPSTRRNTGGVIKNSMNIQTKAEREAEIAEEEKLKNKENM